MILAVIFSAGGVFAGSHGADSSGVQLELWQAINLIGAPLLAVLFAPPVIDDIRAWLTSERK